MRCCEVVEQLQKHKGELQTMGVASLSVFGSTARDEANDSSDVDLLIDLSHSVGLIEFVGIQQSIEKVLGGRKVDLVPRRALREEFRDDVLRETVRAF